MSLLYNKHLTNLDLSWNLIESDGAKFLGNVLERNNALTYLDLSANFVYNGMPQLLKNHKSLFVYFKMNPDEREPTFYRFESSPILANTHVIHCIRENVYAKSDYGGVDVQIIISTLSGLYTEGVIQATISHLGEEGHIYCTIDDDHFLITDDW